MALARGALGATTSRHQIGAGLAGIRGRRHRRGPRSVATRHQRRPLELAQHNGRGQRWGEVDFDLPKTLEVLETQGITVLGYGTDEFPAFFTPSGLAAHRADSPDEVARTMHAKWGLGLMGAVVANPVPDAAGLTRQAPRKRPPRRPSARVWKARPDAVFAQIHRRGTEGKSLAANVALVKHNAMVGGRIAKAYAALG